MPKKVGSDKELLNIRTYFKTWIEIPVERKDDKDVGAPKESYLVPPRVADYIEKLESMVDDLPKLEAGYDLPHDSGTNKTSNLKSDG